MSASPAKKAVGPADDLDVSSGLDRELNHSDESRRLREALIGGPVAEAAPDPRVLAAMQRVPCPTGMSFPDAYRAALMIAARATVRHRRLTPG